MATTETITGLAPSFAVDATQEYEDAMVEFEGGATQGWALTTSDWRTYKLTFRALLNSEKNTLSSYVASLRGNAPFYWSPPEDARDDNGAVIADADTQWVFSNRVKPKYDNIAFNRWNATITVETYRG